MMEDAIDDASAIPPPGTMTRGWLEKRYGRESAPGWPTTIEGDRHEPQTFTRGGPTALCWAWADAVVADLGPERAVRTGYFCTGGGGGAIAQVTDGHDLAMVDGRFLVDGWIAFVEDLGPAVLDLLDPGDRAEATRIHEPFAAWTTPPGGATRIEGEDVRSATSIAA